MKVFYPLGGRKFLLRWRTHNEGSHLIVADSEKAALVAFDRIFEKHPGLDVLDFLEVEVVAPPAEITKKAAEMDLQARIRDFKFTLCQHLKKASKAGKKLPAGFSLCPNKEHWECSDDYETGCRDGIISSVDNVTLYNQYSEKWPFEIGTRENPKLVASRGRVLDDSEDLYCTRADFGHHQHGIVLELVDPDVPRITDVLFFYGLLKKLNMKPLKDKIEAEAKRHKAACKLADKKHREEIKRQEREDIEAVLAVFK